MLDVVNRKNVKCYDGKFASTFLQNFNNLQEEVRASLHKSTACKTTLHPWISWRSENVIIFELINSLQNILWLGNKMNQFWTQESLILVRLTAWMCSTLVIYYLDTFAVIFSKTFIKVPGNQKKQQTFLSIIWSSEIEKNLQRKLFKNYAKSMRLKGLN